MLVTDVTAAYPLYIPPSSTPRSEGIHLSGIIRCIATEVGILKPEWAEELSLVDARTITDPLVILRINIGLAWESHYIPLLPGVVDHPDEMCLDGVYMSKDGESVSSVIITVGRFRTLVVHEVKATYKSYNGVADAKAEFPSPLEQEWMWISQVKGYCKASGTTVGHLHVLFLCGDYTFPIKPMLKVWQIEFSQAELDENWDMMIEYKQHRLAVEGIIE